MLEAALPDSRQSSCGACERVIKGKPGRNRQASVLTGVPDTVAFNKQRRDRHHACADAVLDKWTVRTDDLHIVESRNLERSARRHETSMRGAGSSRQ